jgi:hypothetical protein
MMRAAEKRAERDLAHKHDRQVGSAWYKRDRARRNLGYRFELPPSLRGKL